MFHIVANVGQLSHAPTFFIGTSRLFNRQSFTPVLIARGTGVHELLYDVTT
jgi:hypothetical protein